MDDSNNFNSHHRMLVPPPLLTPTTTTTTTVATRNDTMTMMSPPRHETTEQGNQRRLTAQEVRKLRKLLHRHWQNQQQNHPSGTTTTTTGSDVNKLSLFTVTHLMSRQDPKRQDAWSLSHTNKDDSFATAAAAERDSKLQPRHITIVSTQRPPPPPPRSNAQKSHVVNYFDLSSSWQQHQVPTRAYTRHRPLLLHSSTDTASEDSSHSNMLNKTEAEEENVTTRDDSNADNVSSRDGKLSFSKLKWLHAVKRYQCLVQQKTYNNNNGCPKKARFSDIRSSSPAALALSSLTGKQNVSRPFSLLVHRDNIHPKHSYRLLSKPFLQNTSRFVPRAESDVSSLTSCGSTATTLTSCRSLAQMTSSHPLIRMYELLWKKKKKKKKKKKTHNQHYDSNIDNHSNQEAGDSDDSASDEEETRRQQGTSLSGVETAAEKKPEKGHAKHSHTQSPVACAPLPGLEDSSFDERRYNGQVIEKNGPTRRGLRVLASAINELLVSLILSVLLYHFLFSSSWENASTNHNASTKAAQLFGSHYYHEQQPFRIQHNEHDLDSHWLSKHRSKSTGTAKDEVFLSSSSLSSSFASQSSTSSCPDDHDLHRVIRIKRNNGTPTLGASLSMAIPGNILRLDEILRPDCLGCDDDEPIITRSDDDDGILKIDNGMNNSASLPTNDHWKQVLAGRSHRLERLLDPDW